MQLESLNCNNCGAPLEVAATSNFVTCNHCSTRLAVRRTESSAFTEQLEDIGAKQDEMLNRLKRIERQTQLADLDREWESKKAEFLVTNKHGNTHLPSRAGIVMSGFVALFGLFWTIMAGSIFPPMALFGILFIGFAIYGGTSSYRRLQAYEDANTRYQSQKRQLNYDRADEA